VGEVFGPAIGSVLYMIGGIKFMFFSFGIFFVVSSFFIKVIFKPEIDQVEDVPNEEAT